MNPKKVVVCAKSSNAKPVSVSGTRPAGGGHSWPSPWARDWDWDAVAARRSANMQCAACSPIARA